MNSIYKNYTLRRIITWIAGASIGLLSNAETIKNVSHSPYVNVQFAESIQAMSKNNLENLIEFKLKDKINLKGEMLESSVSRPEVNSIETEGETSENSDYISYKEIDDYINKAFKKIKVPDYINKKFLRTLIHFESSRNKCAISPKGARGLMQLIPDAWNEVDNSDFYKNSFNPEKNIEVGVKYLKWINDYCKTKYNNWDELTENSKRDYIAAAYNGGIGLLEKKEWDINKMPDETTSYIDSLNSSQELITAKQANF